MKKVLLLASITTVLLFSNTAKAQTTVSAGGKTIKLSTEQVAYLHTFSNHAIDSALRTGQTIKNNTTADIIIILLNNRKPAKSAAQYASKQK